MMSETSITRYLEWQHIDRRPISISMCSIRISISGAFGLSLADLCRITGEKQAVVKDTLAGVEHMSLSMAKKIKKASNMSLYDIYYPIVPEKYLV